MWNSFVQGIKNLWAWKAFIWHDRQFDGAFIYIILYKKLDLMYKFYSSDKCMVTVNLRKMAIARELCRRIFNEDYAPYLDLDIFIYPRQFDSVITYESYMQKQDIELLGKILLTQSLGWWD